MNSSSVHDDLFFLKKKPNIYSFHCGFHYFWMFYCTYDTIAVDICILIMAARVPENKNKINFYENAVTSIPTNTSLEKKICNIYTNTYLRDKSHTPWTFSLYPPPLKPILLIMGSLWPKYLFGPKLNWNLRVVLRFSNF